MTSGIKAIETRYKGYRFRSRLEARWAVFFDALGIPWDYEVEGFQLPSGVRYLPDFWLPQQETWVEIKPKTKEWPDTWLEKISELEEVTSQHAVMLRGTPGPIADPYDENNSYIGHIPGDEPYYWCECPFCAAVGVQFDGRSARNKHKANCPANSPLEDKNYNMNSDRLIKAYQAARAARFEHGD